MCLLQYQIHQQNPITSSHDKIMISILIMSHVNLFIIAYFT